MDDKTKANNSLFRTIVLIGIVVIAIAAVITLNNNQNASEYVNESGNLVIEEDIPFSQWFGKAAPDFTVTDIEGNQHTLSNYLGKNVLVVFWATWCPSCKLEIPHLIELRKMLGEDKLTILAISNEEQEILKPFVTARGINYTVAALGNSPLPSPFIDVTGIPTTFFIDPQGKIKFVALGMINLEQTKAILDAK